MDETLAVFGPEVDRYIMKQSSDDGITVRKAIRAYGRTNKVKAQKFGERLRGVVEAYNNRDKLQFTSEVVSDFVDDLSDQLIAIMRDLEADKSSL